MYSDHRAKVLGHHTTGMLDRRNIRRCWSTANDFQVDASVGYLLFDAGNRRQ
jgi:hypothetical protein